MIPGDPTVISRSSSSMVISGTPLRWLGDSNRFDYVLFLLVLGVSKTLNLDFFLPTNLIGEVESARKLGEPAKDSRLKPVYDTIPIRSANAGVFYVLIVSISS